MSQVHRCPYCKKPCKTLGGLTQHINGVAKCRAARSKQLGITAKTTGLLHSLTANKKSAPTRSELALQQFQQQLHGDSERASLLGKRPTTQRQEQEQSSPSPKKKKKRKNQRKESPSPKKKSPPEPESGSPARKTGSLQQVHEAQYGTAKDAADFVQGIQNPSAESEARPEETAEARTDSSITSMLGDDDDFMGFGNDPEQLDMDPAP